MATIAEIEAEMVKMAGFPIWDSPSRHERLTAIRIATSNAIKEAQSTRFPHVVNSFQLDVYEDTEEYDVPADDFAGLYHATLDPTYHDEGAQEVRVINFTDTDLEGFSAARESAHGTRPRAIAIRRVSDATTGEVRKILTVSPRGCEGHLLVWYNVTPPVDQRLSDEVPIFEEFQTTLIPADAILQLLDRFKWPGKTEEENMAVRAGMLNPNNPRSVASIFAAELALFREKAQRPHIIEPSTRLRSRAARRTRRLTRRGRLLY